MTNADYNPEFDPVDVDGDYGSTGGDITVPTFNQVKPFRFWCQKALPLVYDDSLSYYELLCRVVAYLNNMMTDLNSATSSISEFAEQFVTNQTFLNNMAQQLGDNTEALEDYINERMEDFSEAYQELEDYVNTYFNNLDVQEEINNKLDEMSTDGTFDEIFLPFVSGWLTEKTKQIDTDLSNQNATLASQNGRLAVLEGRMDTFSTLPSGSTSANAELADIRTNFLGVTFANAGDAVRTSDFIASGYNSIPVEATVKGLFLDGDEVSMNSDFSTYSIDITPFKGGKLALIFNAYQTFDNRVENGMVIYGKSNVATPATDGCTTFDLPAGGSLSNLKTYTLISGGQTSTYGYKFLLILPIPSNETYRYYYLPYTQFGEGDPADPSYVYPPDGTYLPNRLVYATSWYATPVDATLTHSGEGADAKVTGDAITEVNDKISTVTNTLNNNLDLSAYTWELGSLTPGSGSESTSSTRIRSNMIPVSVGTKISVSGNPNCLVVYLFTASGEYVSDTVWNDGNIIVVSNSNAFYTRIVLRKSSSNDTMTSDDISEQVARCSIITQLPNDAYLMDRKITNLQINGGEYIKRTVTANSSMGQYWNINNDFMPIVSGSVIRFTLNTYSGEKFNRVYFKGRKRNDSTITNVTLVNTQIIGQELIVQTTEDYIGYQVQIYRTAQENTSVTAEYSFAVYDANGFSSYLMEKTNANDNGTLYEGEVKTSVESVQTVLANSDKPMLTFAVFTDLHHDSKYPNDPTNDMFVNIHALNDRLHFDGIINLGDAIDGQNQTQYVAEGFISDVVNSMYNITTERSHSIPGNHDDNVQSTWSSHGSYDASNQLTNLELYEALNKGSYNEVHSSTRFTDYYVDYELYGVRAIFISPNYTAWENDTATWLSNTALDTDKKVIVFSHTATKAEWGYNNDVSNGTIIETALNNFISGGGVVLAFIHGHTHGDMIETASDISFSEVAIGCAKFEKLSSGTSGMTYQDRNVNDYTKILFDIVCVDQTNSKVHFIRCGAGSDRVINY